MVKKKKIFKRVTALAGAVLLLLVAVVPALMGRADAMAVDFVDDSFNVLDSQIYHPQAPFDVFRHDHQGITLENPFYSLCASDGDTLMTEVLLPTVYDDPWTFFISSYRYEDDGSVLAGLYFDDHVSTNSIEFTLSNSSPFVTTLTDLGYFLFRCRYSVPVFYQYRSEVFISGQYPVLVHEGGWSLEDFVFEGDCSYINTTDGPMEIPAFDVESLFLDFPGTLDWDKLVLVESISVTFHLYAPLSASASSRFENASQQRFYMPYTEDGFGYSFQDLYEEYPGHRVIVSDDPGVENFDLGVYLKKSISSFFDTQIIPGLSFGILLSVAISLTLVCVFIRRL